MKMQHVRPLTFIIILFFYISLLGLAHPKPTVFPDNVPVLGEGYYLVVGAFNSKSNAIRYSKHINAAGENSKVGINPNKPIHYVYVVESKDLDYIKSKWIEYRNRPEFADAWVFKNVKEPANNFVDVEKDQTSAEVEIFEEPEEKQPPKIEIPEVADEPLEGEGYSYIFNAINSTTLKEVPGYVTVVDAVRNKVVTSLETNKPQLVPDPGTVDKDILFICDIFGFVKQQVALNLDNPLASGDPNVEQGEDNTTIVNFELVRHKAGDIITMYQVYFYNDAAIMKPESEFELNSLLDMLQENEKLTIKIHGHTNGNAPGPIIKLKDDDNNFFTMTDNNVEGYGSAKDLSYERAKTIKRWLVDQGISEKRMSLKGWGGKKMIYDKKSDQAKRNVRVEIEILKD